MLINLYIKELKKNITISVNENVDNYGNNVSAWESQTKEQRDAKAPRNYVGNGTVVFSKAKEYPIAPKKEFKQANNELNENLPF
jgi:hypothetical protein